MDNPANWGELIKDLNDGYELALSEYLSAEQAEQLLAEKLNTLIRTDFNALVQLLYRIDVSESRLRNLLNEKQLNADEKQLDAGTIIARLVIERQLQKIETRRLYPRDPHGDF